jgi:probable F420-dependent oxidoreductase
VTPAVRCGIHTPVVILLPGYSAPWEVDGTIADIAKVAQAAEHFAYHHVTCSEHVVIPSDVAAVRGARYWDPLATFGYLSAVTTSIRLATNVLVLGYHHPLEIAKRYGTLDRVCNGRLILGLGVGSLKQEFDLLEVPFADRGHRADEALRALRTSLSQRQPSFKGKYYRYSDMVVDPPALQTRMPIWIGGRTARSLRRAVEFGDGWMPFGLSADQLGAMISKIRGTPEWESRKQPLEVVLSNDHPFDPSGDPKGTVDQAEKLLVSGATMLQLHLMHHSVGHYVEQLEAMAKLSIFESARPERPDPPAVR